jgi:hypothetical protein
LIPDADDSAKVPCISVNALPSRLLLLFFACALLFRRCVFFFLRGRVRKPITIFPLNTPRRRGAFDTRFVFLNDFLGLLEFSFFPISEIAALVAESLLLLLFFFFFFSLVDRLCCRFAALLFT